MRFPRVRRSFVLPGVIIALAVLLVGAGGAAAFESDSVGSYWEGLWWALSLMTTVGFVEGTPSSVGGALTSAVLMVAGFLLLSLISAALASLFVREDEEPAEEREEALDRQILEKLAAIEVRLAALERPRDLDPPQTVEPQTVEPRTVEPQPLDQERQEPADP